MPDPTPEQRDLLLEAVHSRVLHYELKLSLIKPGTNGARAAALRKRLNGFRTLRQALQDNSLGAKG